MTDYHVAIDHLESPDPDSPMQVTTTYLGVVDQAHADEVRAIAELPGSERWVKEHPRLEGAFMVLRDDGDLDVYVPTTAAEYRVYQPDPAPKGGFTATMPTVQSDGPPPVAMPTVSGPGANDPMGVDLPRGASGPAYVSGVTRFGDQIIGGASDSPSKPPRAVWHTTESPAGGSYFTSIAAYLIRIGAEPQVIYDPATDRLGQFGPLTQSGRALANDGSYRTNRTGKVCIQVEVLGYARSPWTNGFDPAAKPNYRRLIAAMRAHGIPDVWPVGKPPATSAAATKRPKTTWENAGGHYAHGQIRGQNHWDPGAIDVTIVPGKPASDTGSTPGTDTGTTPAPAVDKDAFPGSSKFGPGANNAYVTRLGQMLIARGGRRFYAQGAGPRWSTSDKNATRAFQQAQGWTGTDADGIPGATTWKLLVEGKGKDIPAVPVYEPFPGEGFFHAGRNSPIITALGRRLVALGFGRHYANGPGPDWTNADKANVRDFQMSRADLKGDADGIPGPKTWAALKVPKI
jgi:hypothetical protein